MPRTKKVKQQKLIPLNELEISAKDINTYLIPYFIPILINAKHNEIKLSDLEVKMKMLMHLVIRNDLTDLFEDIDFVGPDQHLSKTLLQNIIKALRKNLREKFNVKLEYETEDNWCQFKNDDNVDDLLHGFITLRTMAAAQIHDEATINCIDTTKQLEFKNFKENSNEGKFLKVVIDTIANSETGKVKYVELCELDKICKKNYDFTQPKNYEALLHDFIKYDYGGRGWENVLNFDKILNFIEFLNFLDG